LTVVPPCVTYIPTMGKLNSFGSNLVKRPGALVMVLTALSSTSYVACGGDDDTIGGTGGKGGTAGKGGSAGKAAGGKAGKGGSAGKANGGKAGTGVIPMAGEGGLGGEGGGAGEVNSGNG
jgi:hypothetical protein